MRENFKLDEQLELDTVSISNWALCQVLLRNDNNYPWLILVPRRADIIEIYELSSEDQVQLIEEISQVSKIFKSFTNADKINIAAFGNIVSQLHVHIIARYRNDPAWPQVVWGKTPSNPYENAQLSELVSRLKDSFS